MAIKETLEYEFVEILNRLKRTDTWMYVISFFAIIFAIWNKTILLVISLLGLVVLQMKRDYDSGKVIAYQREKWRNRGGENANQGQEGNVVEQAE